MIAFYIVACRRGPESKWALNVINEREDAKALFTHELNEILSNYPKEVRLYRGEGDFSIQNDCLLDFTVKLIDSDTVYPSQKSETK